LAKLSILDGDPGVGKSLLTLDLCARLSTGRPCPDGRPGLGPANALVLNGEDAAADTIRARLEALGADLGRVFVPDPATDDRGAPLRFPAQAGRLDRALAQTAARLLVIDPVMAFLDPRIHSASDQSVRRALLPLARLADRHGCTVLLVRHLNKDGGGRSAYRGGGSIAFLGACRSGWLVAPDLHEPRRRVLAQVKNNLAPPQPSLAYEVHTAAGGPPTLSWLGPTDWTADQLLAGPSPAPPLPERERARAFLTDFLGEGPRTSRQLWAAAQEQGLSERTLQRAKRALSIRSVWRSVDGRPQCLWLLPGQPLPPAVPAADAVPDLEEWLAPLRERFPPATPLDDL
jgi:hypothetical protein